MAPEPLLFCTLLLASHSNFDMRAPLLLMIMGLIAYACPGQNAPADTARVQVLLDHGRACLNRPNGTNANFDSAIQFATQAATLSRQLAYTRGSLQAAALTADAHLYARRYLKAWQTYPLLDDSSRLHFLAMYIATRLYPFAIAGGNIDSAAYAAALLEPLLPAARSPQLIFDAYSFGGGAIRRKGDKVHASELWRRGWQLVRQTGAIGLENEYISRIAYVCYDDSTATPFIFSLFPQLEADDYRLLPQKDSATQHAAVLCVAAIGNSFYYGKQIDACLRTSAIAIRLNEALHQHVSLPYSWLAYIYTSQGRTKEGLAASLDAVRVTETPNGPIDGTGYEAASRTYFIAGNLDKSQEYFYKALALFLKDPSKVGNPGGLFHRAIEILLRQQKPAEALRILQTIIHPPPGVNFTYIDREYFAISAGDCHLALGHQDSAGYYYRHALDFQPLTGYSPGKAMAYSSLANFYTVTHQYARAKPYLDTLMADSNRAISTLNMQENALLQRYQADSALHDYAHAVTHLRLYQVLHDSLINIAKTRQLTEMTVQYETEKKNQHIDDLEKQNALQTHLQQSTVRQAAIVRNSLIAGAALLAILAGVLYNRYQLRQRTNRRLQKLLKEKEWLLREIHHRVKNNLQIIISLLRMQSGQLKDQSAIGALEEISARVNAISLVHKKLYQDTQDMAAIDMGQYTRDLVSYLSDSFNRPQRIAFQLNVDRFTLDVAHCVPLGLILNEAITNAMKYAFPGGAAGNAAGSASSAAARDAAGSASSAAAGAAAGATTLAAAATPANSAPCISITLKQESQNHITLIIADNGIGLPAGLHPESSTSLGLQLIHTLTLQLEGTLDMENRDGLIITVRFPHTGQVPAPDPGMNYTLSY